MSDFIEGIATVITTTAVNGGIGAHEPFTVENGSFLLDIPRSIDISSIAAAAQDPEIQRFTSIPTPYGMEDARYFVDKLSPQIWAKGGANWIIRVQRDASVAFVGTVALRAETQGIASVGYWIDSRWRGHGYMTEACKLAIQTAFEKLGFECVIWAANPSNIPSLKVAWKVGFSFAGVLRGIGCHHGKREDYLVASFVKGDIFKPRSDWAEVLHLV